MGKVLDSNEMMKFLPESGQILNTLRNHLISALGLDRAKGFLLRYGWDCGNNFSNHLRMKDAYHTLTLKELFIACSHMHGITADLGISVKELYIDPVTKDYYSEGYWKHSQEAEHHIATFGLSSDPVCFTLIGFAGGYVSNHLGRKVIFKEVECKGKGDPHCHWIAKPVLGLGRRNRKRAALL
ncbi:V4R domain-containing protein [Aeribacillus sp. FSL M8-0235]|uniref:V4R domain-containing protein n=1 Tax=Aeribacillus sp. FSL M8-0235 TaxID=2954576 RepID=UPI0030FCD4AA